MFTVDEIEKIKTHSEQMEESKTILSDILEIIYEHQLFKIFTPKTLGGLEKPLVDGLKIFQQVGAIDGNVGWAVTIGSGGNMFIPLFDRQLCEKHFNQKEAVIAGSGKFGVAERVNDGYRISGEWKYCSGADYATLFTMNCKIQGSNQIITCSVPREKVEVIPDWNAIGLKATSSHTMKLENVFVNDKETFNFNHFQNEFELPVHRFPFTSFSESSFFSLCLGLTEQFMSEAIDSLYRKKEELSTERFQLVKGKLDEKQVYLQQIEKQFYSLITNLWDKHVDGELLLTDELERLTSFCKEQSGELLFSVHSIIRYFGMEGVFEKTPLNRAWRNLCTASQHAFLTP